MVPQLGQGKSPSPCIFVKSNSLTSKGFVRLFSSLGVNVSDNSSTSKKRGQKKYYYIVNMQRILSYSPSNTSLV